MLSAGYDTKPSARRSAAVETLRTVLARNTLAFKSAEYVYENASYVPHLVRQGLLGRLLGGGRRRHPPRQAALTWTVPFPATSRADVLIAWLRSRGVEIREGGHTFYIPPQAALRSLLPSVVDFYPDGCGFKVLKDLRPPTQARYLYRHRRWLRILVLLIGSPADQLIPANYMYSLGIGPRVWDLADWQFGGQHCTVFVVEHVTGVKPTSGECVSFLERLKRLNTDSRLRILVPHWKRIADFTPPDCNGNLLHSETHGRALYVDFQNFIVGDAAANGAPRTRQPRDTDSAEDWNALAAVLRERAVGLERSLVLDVGCRTGETIRAALGAGAAWAAGWCAPDRRLDIEQQLLLSGATRFFLSVVDERTTAISRDLPEDLSRQAEHAVAFCRRGVPHAAAVDLLRLGCRAVILEREVGETLAAARQLPGCGGPEAFDVVTRHTGSHSPSFTVLIRRG
jgi:hypothetical protein